MKKFLRFFAVLVIFMFLFSSINVRAEENTTEALNEEQTTNEIQTQNTTETEESVTRYKVDEEEAEEEYEEDNLDRRAAVIISKLDDYGNYLPGAVLQILDSDGYLVVEWTSNNDTFAILLPEGTYTLHEVSAPEGYIKAEDKTFTVEIKTIDLDAGVDWSNTPCEHYGGTPLYYVNFNGQKEEVYCINQDWETPDDNSSYDGEILNPTDIRDYLHQTVYVDAQQNKESIDVSDQSLTSEELYNKILDIIYHRQLASDLFGDLTEAEIRYITEAALKNYTNAGLTRVQRVNNTSLLPEGYDKYSYYYSRPYHWYLYPHFRSFVYLPDAELGEDIYKTVVGEGDAFGTIARHWNEGDHNAKNDPDVRAKIARYYELYQYLISDQDHHPEEMLLYIFSTNDKSLTPSRYDFDDGAYQNLLGVRWANPDENIVEINFVNNKIDTGKTEIIPPITGINIISSNISYLIIILLSIIGISLSFKKRFN